MRYNELLEARPWKQYQGRRHRVRLVRSVRVGDTDQEVADCYAFVGEIITGKQEVFQGLFISIVLPNGEELVGEHPRSLRDALKQVCELAERKGWAVLALGRMPDFQETGLSVNTGYGYHPYIPDRHVHMLELPPTDTAQD